MTGQNWLKDVTDSDRRQLWTRIELSTIMIDFRTQSLTFQSVPVFSFTHYSSLWWWWWIGSITIHPLPEIHLTPTLVFLHFHSAAACMKTSATSRRVVASSRLVVVIGFIEVKYRVHRYFLFSTLQATHLFCRKSHAGPWWHDLWAAITNDSFQSLCRVFSSSSVHVGDWWVINANEDSNGGSSFAASTGRLFQEVTDEMIAIESSLWHLLFLVAGWAAYFTQLQCCGARSSSSAQSGAASVAALGH